MRTNKEMLNAVHARAEGIKRARRMRQTRILGGSAAVLALALIVLLAAVMPAFQGHWTPDTSTMQASALADSGMLGYAVVGIVAFLLGVSVTVFCVLLRKQNDEEGQDRDRDR